MTSFSRFLLAVVASALAVRAAEANALRFGSASALTQQSEYRSKETLGAHGVALSPDGRYVYVTAEFDNVVDVYARDLADGALAFVSSQPTQVVGSGEDNSFNPRGLALSPDGRYVYVAGHNDGILGIYARDAATGTLTFVAHRADTPGSENGLGGAEAVLVSPDGAHVYVVSRGDDSVVVYRRDDATGLVTFVERKHDGDDGVDGIAGARGLAISPDGAHLYVAGGGEDAVAIFRRDPFTGALTLSSVLRDGEGGVDGLQKAQSVAVTPDGAQVLVTGSGDDKLAVFRRDPATGALDLLEVHEDGVDGVDGLNGAYGIAISPDGSGVYVTGSVDEALAVFHRDPASGALRYLQRYREGEGPVDGLGEAHGVAVSPDGLNVYAAGHADDAVAVFGLAACGDGYVDPGEECDDGNRVDGDCCSAACETPAPAFTPCADDGNVCTDDWCNGIGRCVHLANTLPCDDRAFCTVGDVCRDGRCGGAPRDCAAGVAACAEGVCDEAADACVSRPRPDGTACDDGTPDAPCTQADRCAAGVCTSGPAVVCHPSDQCHDAGTCNPDTGSCTDPAKPDGAVCDDRNAHTVADACVAGACRGSVDTDGDGILDGVDVCPLVPDAGQADLDGDGVGDACECTSPAPGRCLPGGGKAATDCLLEFNPSQPPAGRKAKAVLRCADGDPACDRDGRADGRCTVGVTICLANADPRLHRCRPVDVGTFELTAPAADGSGTVLDRANALALERTVAATGLEVRRRGQVVAAASARGGFSGCSALVDLVVPAPAARGPRSSRRTFRTRAAGTDGRVDTDSLAVECRRAGH